MKIKSIDLKFDMVEVKKEYALCLSLDESGSDLNMKNLLEKYSDHITCVFFCGDVWTEKDLLENLQICKVYFKTTGIKSQNHISKTIQNLTDYLHIDKTIILPPEVKSISVSATISKPELTDELLKKLYVDDKKSVKDISAEFERDLSTIYRRLKKLGI